MKGHSVPMGPGAINFSIREPLGVVAKIIPFNHPFMFSAGKIAAPLAAGNSVVVKPPEQAPLSTLRFAELIDGLLPAGVFNIATGGREAGVALAAHRDIAMLSLIVDRQCRAAVLSARVYGKEMSVIGFPCPSSTVPFMGRGQPWHDRALWLGAG